MDIASDTLGEIRRSASFGKRAGMLTAKYRHKAMMNLGKQLMVGNGLFNSIFRATHVASHS